MISKEVVQSNVPDEKKVIERDKVDKTIEESLQDICNVEIDANENVPFHNSHNNTTESVNENNLYVVPIARDQIENPDDNREETINDMEEVLEKENQYENSPESLKKEILVNYNESGK